MMHRAAPSVIVAGVMLASVGYAAASDVERGERLIVPALSFASLFNEPPASAPVEAAPASGDAPFSAAPRPGQDEIRHTSFGRAGSEWLSFGPAYAYDFDEAHDFKLSLTWSIFVADELEFGIEGAAWYFNQPGQDTGGLSGSLQLRWHFLHDEEYAWSIFGEVGMGGLASFDLVPDGGTGFNFLPRLGAGVSFEVEGFYPGARVNTGVRWHHISNGRINGDERNPARDGVMLFLELAIPW